MKQKIHSESEMVKGKFTFIGKATIGGVAPYVGAWIETSSSDRKKYPSSCRSLLRINIKVGSLNCNRLRDDVL